MHPIERRNIRTDKQHLQEVSGVSPLIESLLVKRHAPAFMASMIGFIVMLIASAFLYVISEKNFASQSVSALQQSYWVQNQLTGFINENNDVLHKVRAFVINNPTPTDRKFRSFSQGINLTNPFVKMIAWSPAGKVKNIYPLGLNKHLLNTDQEMTAIDRIESSAANLAYRLTNNELLMLRVDSFLYPNKLDSNGNGVITLEIDLYNYLKSIMFSEDTVLFPFYIKDLQNSNSLFRFLEQGVDEADVSETTILNAVGFHWQISTYVKPDDTVSLGFGALLSLLLALLMSLTSYRIICSYKQRSVDVKAGAYRANFDLLTGLPNRYHFSRRLKETLEEAQREQTDFAVFFMDIDHFKQMNDALGHGAGDTILTEFSTRLEFAAKNTDIVARISGDEFVFVAREVDDVIKADLLAEKLKKHLQQPIEFAGQQHFITVSMGVAMYPIDGADAPSLLHHSDQAMYAAKRAGRNRHFFFNEGMREQAETYLTIHQDLLRGLEAGEFELYYQPVLNVNSESVDICEALIRWNHPDKGLVMPDKFIPVAERTGAIREIGNWAFGQACRDIREFIDGDIDIKIAINHSISEYYSNRAFERWKRILKENSVTGDRFIFEIPEALLMDKKSIRMSVVTAMRKMGVQFAIDDFGTGHSAINYLRNYPADILKIDSSLIHGMQKNSKDRTLVEVVLTLARSLGKVVVAEGVENDIVAAQLKELHCDYLQGNWLLEPKPIQRLIPYLHQHMFELEERVIGKGSDGY
jgi:diguanylate cyclase (GGDEF)-like protein